MVEPHGSTLCGPPSARSTSTRFHPLCSPSSADGSRSGSAPRAWTSRTSLATARSASEGWYSPSRPPRSSKTAGTNIVIQNSGSPPMGPKMWLGGGSYASGPFRQ